ncbi:hypothetical protein V6N13_086698 [Hibiscus sabdariffa]
MNHTVSVNTFAAAAAVFVVEPTIMAPQRGYLRTKITKTAATANLSEALGNLKSVIIGIGFMFSSWKLTCMLLSFFCLLKQFFINVESLAVTIVVICFSDILGGSSSYCSCHDNRNLNITQAMAALVAEVHKNYNVL